MRLCVSGPARHLRGEVSVPGDKSITQRALIFGALADGTSHLRHGLRAGVSEATIDCLRRLGIDVEVSPADEIVVHGGDWRAPVAPLDCRNSGATMRMMMGALAGRSFTARLTGSPGLLRRPMGRVIEPLRRMGASIVGTDGADRPPFTIRGGSLRGIEYRLPVASAQLKTAVLIAALSADGPTTLHEPGPSRDHTERMLRSLGVPLTANNGSVTLVPDSRRLPAFDLDVPGDFSSAAFALVAALVVPGSEVTLRSVTINPTRTGLPDTLADMGAEIRMENLCESSGEPVADLVARSSGLRGAAVSGDRVVRMIDEFPVFAVAATQAEGETVVRDAAELRVKESDRITTLAGELSKMGARIAPLADGFLVEGPTRLRGARVASHGDHRLAMSLAVAGLIAEGETAIEDAECIGESFPNFIDLMRALGADFR